MVEGELMEEKTEIANYIEGTPMISVVLVESGLTNANKTDGFVNIRRIW
jgi:hypothetical protein